MVFNFLKTNIVVISLLAFAVGCDSDLQQAGATNEIVADVLSVSDLAPESPEQLPQYVFGPKKFELIKNISSMSAPGLRLIQGGDIEILSRAGSLITSGLFSGGSTPFIDYSIQSGVVRAKDDRSLAMLSAMFQFDSLFDSIERLSGVSRTALLNSGQEFQVIYQPSILIKDEGDESRRYETGNAAYIAGARQFALYKSGVGEDIPLIINPQVVAHEFGHAIFELSFFQNSYQACERSKVSDEGVFPGRLELEYVIRGLNEGFADFVSFVWTGSTNLLESSFGKTTQTDQRNFSTIEFKYTTLSEGGEPCTGEIYCLGSIFARSLLDTYVALGFDVRNKEQREAFLQSLFSILKTTGSQLRDGVKYRLPIVDDKVAVCKLRDARDVTFDDEILSLFLMAFLDSSRAEQKQAFCKSFAENFGESGFSYRSRSGCS